MSSSADIVAELNLKDHEAVEAAVEALNSAFRGLGDPAPRVKRVADGERLTVEIPRDIVDPASPATHLAQMLRSVLRAIPAEARVSRLAVPEGLFRGPRLGLKDVRRYTGIRGPLLGVVIRAESREPFELAKRFYELAASGADLGLEPEFLVDHPDSPISARASHAADMMDRVKEETGRRPIYVVSVESRADALVDRVQEAADAGLPFAAVEASSLASIEAIAALDVKIGVYARGGPGYVPMRWLSPGACATLLRLAGAGMVERPSAGSAPRASIEETDSALLGKIQGIRSAMPSARGVMHPGSVEANVSLFGANQVLLFDEGVYDHPWGYKSGVSAARAAIDAALRGEGFFEAVEASEEMRVAVDRWGYLAPDAVR